MIGDAYASFGHPAVAPLKQLDDNQWLLELFHGPTLAFKDVAMQLLARLMDWALAPPPHARHHRRRHHRRHRRRRHRGLQGIAPASVFMLHPHGRVSEVQRRQMTTVDCALHPQHRASRATSTIARRS